MIQRWQQEAVHDESMVLEVLGSSELLVLIYKVDYAYHSRFSDSQSNNTLDNYTVDAIHYVRYWKFWVPWNYWCLSTKLIMLIILDFLILSQNNTLDNYTVDAIHYVK
ncbi:uncharacterized protein [Triticum aestivum]|uniref:uncharacterized protein n=1 Tax=Triticum aestivum TaxID=4565 RepID=UPI001D0080B9|nr:uncharacterized protein LOC123058254 [Triticum aestivum]